MGDGVAEARSADRVDDERNPRRVFEGGKQVLAGGGERARVVRRVGERCQEAGRGMSQIGREACGSGLAPFDGSAYEGLQLGQSLPGPCGRADHACTESVRLHEPREVGEALRGFCG